MITRLYQANELAARPADKDVPSRAPSDRPSWVYGWNLSPFVLEIQDEAGVAQHIALPFAPFKHKLNVRTEKIIVHASSGAMVPAAPLAAADLAVWITVSEFEPDLIPGPW